MKFWGLLYAALTLCSCRMTAGLWQKVSGPPDVGRTLAYNDQPDKAGPSGYVEIIDAEAGGHGAERAFLESLLGEYGDLGALGFKPAREAVATAPVPVTLGRFGAGGGGVFAIPAVFTLPETVPPPSPPVLFMEILSSWNFEAAWGEVLISRSPLVPREDALAGRTGTTLAACLEGKETLVPPEEISPPFVALRVEGRALGEEGYPLVRSTGVRLWGGDDPQSREQLRLVREVLKAVPKPLIRPPEEIFWIAAGGDLMLGRGAGELLLTKGPQAVFGGTAEMLAQADLSLVNLEGVISLQGKKTPKSFNFRFNPATAPALRQAGIDAVLHANNHVYDYGGEAFLDSLSRLGEAGIGVAGAGSNEDAAAAPLIFRRGASEVRVFGLASFPRERNGWDGTSVAAGPNRPGILHAGRGGDEKLAARFTPPEASANEDIGAEALNVVLFHGGREWSTRPDPATRELYTGLIRAGAGLIIGSHPHIVQGFEWVLGKPVFWSLGNYVFSGMDGTGGGDEGLFLRLGFRGDRLLYLEPFALNLVNARTEIAPPAQLARFYARSRELRDQKN